MTRAADYDKLALWALMVGAPILYLSFGYTEMAGSDMWWHVAAGRELVQTGTVWMVDDWSFTEHGSDWLNHEWLADLVYYGWVSLFGLEALVYWKWLVVIATFTLLQLALARTSGSHLAAVLCAGSAAAIAAPFIDVRPHLYTLLNFCLLLYLLLGRRANVWLLAPLFVLWVNLHGGFFFGLMALAILIFPWRDFNLSNFRAALLVGIACAAAAILNPSGLGTFLYPLKYAFDETSPFRSLGEWHPPHKPGGIRSPLFFYFQWLPLAAALYALPWVRKKVSVPWEGLCLTALTLAMALTSRRFIPIFAISLAVLMAPLVGLLLKQVQGRVVHVVLAFAVLWFALWRQFPYPLQARPAFHFLIAEFSYPVDLVNFVVRNELQGKVFAYYNWGGYLHWRTDGDFKVYIDGRADTLYDAPTYLNYVAVLRSSPDWLARVEATGAEFMLWPNQRAAGAAKLQEMFDSGRWRGLYQDADAWLLVRTDVQLPPNLTDPPQTPWRDLTQSVAAVHAKDLRAALRYAQKVRQVQPWNKRACDIAVGVHRHYGNRQEGEAVLRECRSYFPSRWLDAAF